jgi:hypothetical protein
MAVHVILQYFHCYIQIENSHRPVPVAEPSKACVCGLSPAEIMGSNPTVGMDVCLL